MTITTAVAVQVNHNFPDFSPTNVKFPDFSKFSRWVAALPTTVCYLTQQHITLPLDGVQADWTGRRTTHGVVAADGVDEVVAGSDAGTSATSTQRRAGGPAVCVWAVTLHRAETRRTITTTNDEQPNHQPVVKLLKSRW